MTTQQLALDVERSNHPLLSWGQGIFEPLCYFSIAVFDISALITVNGAITDENQSDESFECLNTPKYLIVAGNVLAFANTLLLVTRQRYRNQTGNDSSLENRAIVKLGITIALFAWQSYLTYVIFSCNYDSFFNFSSNHIWYGI